jgi:hypothetical protein
MDVFYKGSNRFLEGAQDLLLDESTPNFGDFAEVTDLFMEGYARFSKLGWPDQTIALAMLGATINLYDLFGMRGELPGILRNLADRIEAEERKH